MKNSFHLERMCHSQTHDSRAEFIPTLNTQDGRRQNQHVPQELQVHRQPPAPGHIYIYI